MGSNFKYYSVLMGLVLLLQSCGSTPQEKEGESEEQGPEHSNELIEENGSDETDIDSENSTDEFTSFEQLLKKFEVEGVQLSQADLAGLFLDYEISTVAPPLVESYFNTYLGHVFIVREGYSCASTHCHASFDIQYFDNDGYFINHEGIGMIVDDYRIFMIQENVIGFTSSYEVFEEGEFEMESTDEFRNEVHYFVEQNNHLVPIEKVKKSTLPIIRNQLFAWHGYIFKNEFYSDYFSEFGWYEPRYDNVDHLLSEQEKAFADYLLILEND